MINNEKLVWTSAMEADYRPSPASEDNPTGFFTAIIMLESTDTGTRYSVIARHSSAAHAEAHQQMGFEGGWGTALEQMVSLIKTGSIT